MYSGSERLKGYLFVLEEFFIGTHREPRARVRDLRIDN